MTMGNLLRSQNKHRKIVFMPFHCPGQFLVRQTENTLDPHVGDILCEDSVQHFIDDGYTVVIKEPKK